MAVATRTIVTSQPDVACDVCERRLLRGEQPDIFLAAGRRRTVCELCAPRAAHEGWMRERDSQSMTLPPLRARRGRSFFERLRQVGRPTDEAPSSSGATGSPTTRSSGPSYDFLDGYSPSGGAQPVPATPHESGDDLHAMQGEPSLARGGAADGPAGYLERALGVFNGSEYPRRVAGVARSLGAPEVNVRSAEHLESIVLIVVAWELSWYRYEVDLSEDQPQARATAQGTELGELEREERIGNAIASETGTLSLGGPQT
jgi:hypothetical protein